MGAMMHQLYAGVDPIECCPVFVGYYLIRAL